MRLKAMDRAFNSFRPPRGARTSSPRASLRVASISRPTGIRMLRIVQTEIASQTKRTAAVIQATIIRRSWSGTVVVVVVVVVTASTMGEAIAGGKGGTLRAGSALPGRSSTVRDSDTISGTEARSPSRAAANFAV